jgi:hypothetical protein
MCKPDYILSKDLGLLCYASNPRPNITIFPQQLSMQKMPMTMFCKMANSVMGKGGELLEYRHLIANPNTRAMWTHSYGNKIGRLAQGMPGHNTGNNALFFIHKNQVSQERAKDVTYGLITCLIRPEKLDEPNRTRLVAGRDRVYYPGNARTPTANLLTVKLLINNLYPRQEQNLWLWTSRTFTSIPRWPGANTCNCALQTCRRCN